MIIMAIHFGENRLEFVNAVRDIKQETGLWSFSDPPARRGIKNI